MHLITANVVFAISIFALTIFAGLIPLKIAKHNARFLTICNAFASGVFLSTALLHLLPNAAHAAHSNYPIAYLVCMITFVILLILERGMAVYSNKYPTNKLIMPIFLITLLSIHSIIEGAAIGANSSILEAATIFFAVFAHKSSESFALTVNLNHFGISFKNIKRVIIWFALMTPIGIFIAASLISGLTHNHNNPISMVFHATTAGTFLYLGIEHLASSKKAFGSASEILALIFGVTLMALVAVWG